MNLSEIVIGDRVLVQSGEFIKEVAKVKAFLDNGLVLVKLADGNFSEINPQYILKSFGQ